MVENQKSRQIKIIVLSIIIVIILAVVGIFLYSSQDSDEKTSENPVPAQIQSDEISYAGVDGKTALELLKSARDAKTSSFDNMGEFVISIDGKVADGSHFWALYINGEMAQVGAGEYQTKNGETITWKLEEIK